jgi:hypothetical protein
MPKISKLNYDELTASDKFIIWIDFMSDLKKKSQDKVFERLSMLQMVNTKEEKMLKNLIERVNL